MTIPFFVAQRFGWRGAVYSTLLIYVGMAAEVWAVGRFGSGDEARDSRLFFGLWLFFLGPLMSISWAVLATAMTVGLRALWTKLKFSPASQPLNRD
jgi:hypothetical protein